MKLFERLSALMDQREKTIDDLKNAAGVSYEMARRYKLGIAEPRKDKLEKIAAFLGVSPSWLQFGSDDGSMPTFVNLAGNDTVIIDVLNVEASAGNGAVGDLIEIVNQLRYVPEQFYAHFRGMNPETIRVINIRGDSMHPTFNSGDMIFVDVNTHYFDGDGVYVFTYKGNLFVKRLQNIGDHILVISDNPTYKEWTISEENYEQLHIQGKVKVHQSQTLNFIG